MESNDVWKSILENIFDDQIYSRSDLKSIFENYSKYLILGDEEAKKSLYSLMIDGLEIKAERLIELLDYMTSNYGTKFILIIDNPKFISTFFSLIQKYSIYQSAALILIWKEKVKETSILFRDLLIEFVINDQFMAQKLKEKPKLQYLESNNPILQNFYQIYLNVKLLVPDENKNNEKKAYKIVSREIKNLNKEFDAYNVNPLENDADGSTIKKLKNLIVSLNLKIKELKKKIPKKNGAQKPQKDNSSDIKINQLFSKESPKNQVEPVAEKIFLPNVEIVQAILPPQQLKTNLEDLNSFSNQSNIIKNPYKKENQQNSGPSQSIQLQIQDSLMSLEDLLQYKTKPCKNNECPYKPTKSKNEKFKNKDFKCTYFHFAWDQRRELSYQDEHFNYHAKVCDKLISCKYKGKCFFGHNFFESYFHPLYYKKFSCQQNLQNDCDKSKFCPYIHNKEEEAKWDAELNKKFNIDRSLNKSIVIDRIFKNSEDVEDGKKMSQAKNNCIAEDLIPADILLSRQLFLENEKFNLHNEYNIYTTDNIEAVKDQKCKFITETISAFLNGEGGYVFIGINKHGELIGCDMNDEEIDKCRNHFVNLLQKFSPKPYQYLFEAFPLKLALKRKKWVLRIKIEKGLSDKLYANEAGESFYRISGKTKKYTPDEVYKIVLQKGAKKQSPDPSFQNNNFPSSVSGSLQSLNTLMNQIPYSINRYPSSSPQLVANQSFPFYQSQTNLNNPGMMNPLLNTQGIGLNAPGLQSNMPYQYTQSTTNAFNLPNNYMQQNQHSLNNQINSGGYPNYNQFQGYQNPVVNSSSSQQQQGYFGSQYPQQLFGQGNFNLNSQAKQ